MALPVTGCSRAMISMKEYMGIPKRQQMVDRVTDARDSQTEVKKTFQSTLDEFIATTKVNTGDLEGQYKKFKSKYDESEAAAARVRSRIADVERVADALFVEWQGEIKQISNPSLQTGPQQQLVETKAQYERLLGSMKTAASKMDKPLTNFKDQTLVLKSNLNARAIAGLEGTAREVTQDVDKLIQDMNTSIDEATSFINSMQNAK